MRWPVTQDARGAARRRSSDEAQARQRLGHWPDGSTRNLTWEQVLMMGQDIADVPSARLGDEVPF